MKLPVADVRRKLEHTRSIECRGYRREDGLWDIEGHLTDVKTETVVGRAGGVDLPAGEPAHDMWIRLTIDLDMVVHAAVAVTSASPYPECGAITRKFASLVGLKIDRGWTSAIKSELGGVNGCTHQWELLGRIASTAYQATNRARSQARASQSDSSRPRVLDTCHIYASDSPIVLRRWPQHYRPPAGGTPR